MMSEEAVPLQVRMDLGAMGVVRGGWRVGLADCIDCPTQYFIHTLIDWNRAGGAWSATLPFVALSQSQR